MAEPADRGVPLSTLCPKFLHTNSTSHTWPFSAIAELIDNAYDPDVKATKFWIDKTLVKEKEECLSFMDNGNGLDFKTMHKMLSFGYSDKTALNGQEPIGMYGNGFKSGSMRLGKDAIVFSKSKTASCIGMLSQTYLEQIGAKQIIVPIVCFEQGDNDELNVREEHKASLQDILRYSPFKTQKDLLFEISVISSSWSSTKTGTRIIIWNLRRTSTGNIEFDFETDRYDIRIPSDVYETMKDSPQNPVVTPNIPESVFSLRAYCSILYLKPRMQIIIRGNKVKSQLIAKTLAHVRKDYYKPTFLKNRVPITFGYNTKSKDHYGIMMYHKNRLIKAYERIGCQTKASNKGVGVIGVIECNFLDPTHNKQSFIETDKYRKTLTNLAIKLEEYWREIRHKKNTEDPNSMPVEDTVTRPDQNWVQCDECSKWRKLPDGIDCGKLPDKWFCYMNPDHQFRNCMVEQEPVDSDDEMRPSYRKTYKLQEREEKKNREMKKQKEEEDRKRKEQSFADLTRQHKALEQKHKSLRRQLLQQSPNSPSAPTTPRSRVRTETPEGGAAAAEYSIISQAACSPSSTSTSTSGFPVISNVCTLSPGSVRGKRAQPVTPQTTPKRAKVNGSHLVASDTSTSMDVSPPKTPSVPVNDDDDDIDDDIFILEEGSTLKPQKLDFDLTKVKTEQEKSNNCMLQQCGDAAALDDTSDMNDAEMGSSVSPSAGTSPLPASPSILISITTQTEAVKIKKEEEDQSQTEGQSGREQISDAEINTGIEQREIKQESSEGTHGDHHGKQTLQKGLTIHLNSEDDAGPSFADTCDERGSSLPSPSILQVQEQQDQLIELMQATAQERDSFKQQVSELTCKLEDMQSRLQELSRITEKEISTKASQTEETEGGDNYKSLFEKAKQKVNELIEEKESLLASAEIKPNAVKDEEKDTDEIALQVEYLLQELDQRNKERDELRSQVDSLEEERANLASTCEELRMSLQQQIENAQEKSTTPHRTTDSSVQTDAEEAEGAVGTDTCSDSDTTRSLIDLRHNIGRLLVSCNLIPALDLSQVNYKCNVIDEILEQFLSSRSYEESDGPADLRDEVMNT